MKHLSLIAQMVVILSIIAGGFVAFNPNIVQAADCGGVANCGGAPAPEPKSTQDLTQDLYDKYINPLINVLSALVGLVIVASIIYGGIQYASSEGDPGKVTAAKQRITNSLIALVAYILLFGFLNFLIPGGILN